MAFDQNLIPKDLKPLNIVRTTPEEPRIVAATATASMATTTTGRNPEFFANPDGSMPVIYPAKVPDAGFVGLGYGNPAPGVGPWASVVPVPIGSVHVGANTSAVGFSYNPNLGNRVVRNAVDYSSNDMVAGFGFIPNSGHQVIANGNTESTSTGFGNNSNSGNRGSGSGIDQGSEEGRDDSVSGKKVKFLCSYGGKILPRLSDCMLRYVGGQTRIISVRRDVSFNELLQKMMDTYGQPVVVKYQLPGEDLDSLVSVSCPDDLDNMMDEYEKLVERSSDGSAKLRVFLFSPSQLDASGAVQFADLHDNGQRYVEAVNGIVDGAGSGSGITRKESMASVTSTQNSDFSGAEAVDSSGPGQRDVTGPPSTMLSSGGNSTTSHDTTPKLLSVDPNPPVYADASAGLLGIPMVKCGPPQTLCPQPEVEIERSAPVTVPQQQMGYDFHQAGMSIPPRTTQLQAYMDSLQEITSHADSMHRPPQMGFPSSQLAAHVGSVLTRQDFCNSNAGATSHQFNPAVHMTMAPSSSLAAITSTTVQPLMQPQQTHLGHYPDESLFGKRVAQPPVDPSYNMYQGQLLPTIVGGGYGWRQVPQPEPVVFSDGSISHQQVIFPEEKISRLEDCYMCQKALPHAHSDPLVQDQRECSISPLSDSNSVHHSLHLKDAMKDRPINRIMVTGTLGEGIIDQGGGARPVVTSHIDHQAGMPQSEAIVFSQNLEAHHENERNALQKMDSSDQRKISFAHGMMGLPADMHSSYGMFTGGIPQSRMEDSVLQHLLPTQYLVKKEILLNKPINSDVPHAAGAPIQASDCLVYESPKEYSGKLPHVVSKEDVVDSCISYDQSRPVEGMMETLQVCPLEININNDQSNSPVDKFRKEEILDHRTQQITGREAIPDNTLSKTQVVLDSNHIKQTEVFPASAEVSYMYNSQPIESYEVAQQPILGSPGSDLQSKIGIHLLNSAEVGYGIPASSGVESIYVNDRIPPVVEWKNEVSQLQSRIVPGDVEALSSTNNALTSLPPSTRVGDVKDSSNSLFSSQDPWNLRHDTPFPPPRPNKTPTKKEAYGITDPFKENHLGNAGHLMADVLSEDGVPQPQSNLNKDFSSEQVQSSKEEIIRQELQAVAEGVAASIFQSASTNPEPPVAERNESAHETNQDKEVSNKDVEKQHKTKFEEMKSKLPEKANFGFPVSEGIGRLQIIKNSDLEELQELGSGTFGTVYHGKWRGTDVAIKRINDRCFAGKPSEQERMIDDFWNEAIKLADLHHPNVLAFYGVVLDGPGGSVATVTEYMVNGSLRNALQKNERSLDKRKRLLIAMDVAFGMEYLHGKNIVHFDLKSDNLLVNLRDPHRPICKVGDLGLSKVKCQTLISGGVRGTLPWMAPELLNGSSSLVSEKVDVFSFGIVLWELFTGEEPYSDLHYGAIIGGIVSNTLRPPVPEACDLEWRSLMERCWSSKPPDRPSFTEVVNDLRGMAAKIPLKGQNPAQQLPSTQPQVQK